MLGVADLLTKRGAKVVFSSSGEVASFIEKRGYVCNRLPLADVAYTEGGELSLKRTVAATPLILGRTYRQLGMELANMKRFGPDVVLSDSVVSTVVAARLIDVRSYTILNQLNLAAQTGEMRAVTLLLSEGTTAGMAKLWSLSDRVLLPDLPPPYTISESNLRDGKVKDAQFIGFLADLGDRTPDGIGASFSSDPRPKVFWQVSGPPKTRGPLIRKARQIISKFSKEYVFVLTDGNPRGGHAPKAIDGGWEYEWCDVSSFYHSVCDIVVSRAGHSTIAQSILNSKPSLLVPIPGQTEQHGNAAKAARLGVAIAVEQDDLSAQVFGESVEKLRAEPCFSRSRELGKIARSYDAAGEIVRIVEGSSSARRGPRGRLS
jgi:UDP:flavonoid glycosyltransferase YjiC (YdhE family)